MKAARFESRQPRTNVRGWRSFFGPSNRAAGAVAVPVCGHVRAGFLTRRFPKIVFIGSRIAGVRTVIHYEAECLAQAERPASKLAFRFSFSA